MSALPSRIDELARVPILLVACDYDGTLAPIVANPGDARPLQEAVAALRNLSLLPSTHVAIVSGRALRDLSKMIDVPPAVHLVGSHGGESSFQAGTPVPGELQSLRDRICREFAAIARATPGALVEEKPGGAAFHYRNVEDRSAEAALQALRDGPARHAGGHVLHGKKVFEISVVETSKGAALQHLRGAIGASAVFFAGDDVTDETVFSTLGDHDLSVKVGEGDTAASHRVTDPNEVAMLLSRLYDNRSCQLGGLRNEPSRR